MLIRDGGAENAAKTADVRWNVWLMSKYKSASLTLTRGWNRTRSNRLLPVSKAAAHCVTTRETKNLQSLDKDNGFSEKQDFWFCDVKMKKIWCHPTSLTSLRRLKQLLVFYGCQGSSAGPSVCQRGRETLSGRKSDRKSNRTYQKARRRPQVMQAAPQGYTSTTAVLEGRFAETLLCVAAATHLNKADCTLRCPPPHLKKCLENCTFTAPRSLTPDVTWIKCWIASSASSQVLLSC